jgi:hypothetical protein
MDARPIDHYLLLDGPPVVALRVVLGLTVYTDPRQVTGADAARILRAFLDLGAGERFNWYRTSQVTEWRRLHPGGLREVIDALAQSERLLGDARHRHLFSLALADDLDVPEHGFRYVEVDPARADRAGVIELSLPQSFPAPRLAALAAAVADNVAFFAGVGGFTVRWNDFLKASAFRQIHALCRRHVCVDIQDTEPMCWRVPRGLPGCNWLTLVGAALLDSPQFSPAARAELAEVAALETRSRGLLVRIGDAPVTGDLNQLVVPDAYVAVARLLAPAFVPEPPELWGTFARQGDSASWFLRLANLAGWVAD